MALRDSAGRFSWAVHSGFDLAAIDITDLEVPKGAVVKVFAEELLATEEVYRSLGLGESDSTFVIVYDSSFNRRLIRGGLISSMLQEGSFLMEATNFPGDSGSPVILQPSISRKPGVIESTGALVIGVISDTYRRMVPIAKFSEQRDLLFPQPLNLSLVQPSFRVLDLLAAFQ